MSTFSRHGGHARLHLMQDLLASLVVLAVVLLGAGYGVLALHQRLVEWGLSDSLLQSGLVWLVTGIVCSLYWPLRYRNGMRGHWLAAAPQLALLSLTGPFALILGVPV